jgi:hypothetical protein
MPPENDHNVYDKDGEKPVAGSGSDDPKTIHKNPAERDKSDAEPRDKLRGAEESGEGFYNPTGDQVRKDSLASAHESLSELAGAKPGASGGLYNQGADQGPKVLKTLKHTLRQRRKAAIGGGAVAGVGTIVLVTFFLLIPLKIEHVVNNLEKRFFATSQDAVQKESNILLRGYMIRILPSYKTCGSTISKDCRARISGNGPVNNLYRTWANARLENKLATNYGIEFKYDKTGKNWYLKAPGANSGGDNIGPDGHGLNSDFSRADRAGMRAAINDAMDGETRWKKVMYRYKVGRLLEEKYGIKRCITFCGTRDQLADKVDKQKKSATLYFVQRVLGLRENSLGVALECMLNGCNPTDTHPTQAQDGTTGALNGSPENAQTDTAVREADQAAAKGFVGASADEIAAKTATIEEKGLSRAVFEEVMTKVGLGGISSKAADAIPVVGLVIAGSQVIHFAHQAGPIVQKLGYIVNSGTYAQTYQMYSTDASEIHTGKDTATEIGSFTNSLGPGNRGNAKNPQIGGTGGAESSMLYRNIVDHESPQTTATALNGLLPGKAYADSSVSKELCSDGKAIPVGLLICPELKLGQSVAALDAANTFLNLPVIGQITYLADNISGLTSTIGSIFGDILTSIPGVGAVINSVTGLVAGVIQPFFMAAINVLIPNPTSLYMSGSRLFDIMAGGADVAGNLFAQVGLGGQALTDQQANTIITQQQTEAQQNFARQSMFARMFDTSSEYSLISKVAMTVPFGLQADAQSGVASLLNPLNVFSNGFGSLFSGRVSATPPAQPDAFGVTQYGVVSLPENQDAYWARNCSENASFAYRKDNSWNEEAAHTVDKATGMPRNNTPNPCLTIKASTGILGGAMNTDLLTQDDLTDQGSSVGGGVTGSTVIDGEPKELAKALVDSGRLTDEDGRYMAQIKAVANGNYSCNVNPYILKMLYGVVVQDKHTVKMSSLNRYCTGVLTASGTGSYHYRDGGGHAIDVTGFDGADVNGTHQASTLGYLNEAAKYLPKNTGFGQVQSCSSGFNIPDGDYPVPDECTHQHIQVPVKKLSSP